MANDLTLFGGSGTNLAPSYLNDIFGGTSNIPPKQTIPQLSMKGKNFRIILDGEETVMTRIDPDTGEATPISSIKLVVLNMSKRAARSYYPGVYNPENVTGPACFSLDGEKPDSSVAEPQSTTCASCPMSQKGSKISASSGKAITACTMQRRLVVVPANKLDFEPLLLRLAPTSAWDKNNGDNEGQGWYAWKQYLDYISARGVKHTAGVVTMVKFDTTEYPKLLFKPDRFLTAEEAAKIKDVWNSEKVRSLLEAKDAVAHVDDAPEPFEQMAAPTSQPAIQPPVTSPKATKAKPTPTPPVSASPAASPSEPSAIGGKLADLLNDWGE